MEFANLAGAQTGSLPVRAGTKNDAIPITRLLKNARYRHVHVDWRLPIDWLGSDGFVVSEDSEARQELRGLDHVGQGGSEQTISGCLAVEADPAPAAWVRVAAVEASGRPYVRLSSMMASVLRYLRQNGVIELGWLGAEGWPDAWIYGLGFEPVNKIETYWKDDLSLSEYPVVPGLAVREVRLGDMEQLATIEADAFAPLWRHSANGLALARKQSIGFDVATMRGRVVGFQLSTSSHGIAHLVRLTVDPAFQGLGIGSTLLARAFDGYRAQGLERVSLNTQVDNVASQKLYRKFGFYSKGERTPVWALTP
jgi:ribosomal-protein-alanine N-acetyltransferase